MQAFQTASTSKWLRHHNFFLFILILLLFYNDFLPEWNLILRSYLWSTAVTSFEEPQVNIANITSKIDNEAKTHCAYWNKFTKENANNSPLFQDSYSFCSNWNWQKRKYIASSLSKKKMQRKTFCFLYFFFFMISNLKNNVSFIINVFYAFIIYFYTYFKEVPNYVL